MSLEWKETSYPNIFVHPSGRVIDRSTGREFVGPIIEVQPRLRVQRAALLLTTFSPPPKNCRCYVVYRDNDSTNLDVSNLQWRVDAWDLIRAAEEASDAELEELIPTLLQLVSTVANKIQGIRLEAHSDIFTTH